VVSQSVCHGAPDTVAIGDHVPAPAGETSKRTVSRPLPPSSEADACSVTVAPTGPCGAVSEADGATPSTITTCDDVYVVRLPARSATWWRYWYQCPPPTVESGTATAPRPPVKASQVPSSSVASSRCTRPEPTSTPDTASVPGSVETATGPDT